MTIFTASLGMVCPLGLAICCGLIRAVYRGTTVLFLIYEKVKNKVRMQLSTCVETCKNFKLVVISRLMIASMLSLSRNHRLRQHLVQSWNRYPIASMPMYSALVAEPCSQTISAYD
ncbi:hypothetical protein CaCOL14_004914 [Colletotrichum acutatum]|uniref:Uncharacterized protein n=1 Tax=Glomerella acutata TaxID=27357 RepID=A0AAD8URK5_GLOAC|nr:uncharacterized protein BDZ83DRAFT_612187 [Colletotrichum acutatum]KAK1727552.1 hypothetical protein BDZ83DRAFT_612187 [Colletotrichum acutatum]